MVCCKLFFITIIYGVLLPLSIAGDDKTPCQGCRDLVDGLLKGLDKTLSKNFGGGDVHWEEKRNLKYKTSELRMVEVIEAACPSSNFQCNKILEEHEEDIEKWYKSLQDEEPISLLDFLCVETAKVCCAENKFGEKCEDCPKGNSDKVCFGRGKCQGAGDKQGSGKCECDTGYSGDICNECADRYFKSYSNDTYILCTLCHETCQTCEGGSASDCETCRTGYKEETDDDGVMKCVDLDECTEKESVCPIGQRCINTVGSYKCEDWKCHPTCERCYGPTHAHCFACIQGAIMRRPFMCQDIDECASGAVCLGMYEVCVNTFGHYKCECARFFKRNTVTGQCQPDPSIYSHHLPMGPEKKVKEIKEEPEEKENPEEEPEQNNEEEDEKDEL